MSRGGGEREGERVCVKECVCVCVDRGGRDSDKSLRGREGGRVRGRVREMEGG